VRSAIGRYAREEVRQEFLRNSGNARERLLAQFDRLCAAADAKKGGESDPEPDDRVHGSEPPVIESRPQTTPEAPNGRNGQLVEPTRNDSLYTNPVIQDEPQSDRRPLSVQYRHLMQRY
jgi:hypothetical protein